MPRTNAFKIGVALAAAVAGVILAITSVAAHSAQTPTLHASGKSAIGLVTFAKMDALKGAAEEQADAAELAAKLKAEAAKAAAEVQQDAVEAAAAAATQPCLATDPVEDANEKTNQQAADKTEDAAHTPGTDDSQADATLKAANKAEDVNEGPCPESGAHQSESDHNSLVSEHGDH